MSFDMISLGLLGDRLCLNPFRAGQCLSTFQMALKRKKSLCLNPFRAGRCLSTERQAVEQQRVMSQSLSIRAMSFD